MRCWLPLSLLLVGCNSQPADDAEIAWALNWAEVTPTADGIEGFQVWELFLDGWEKKHDGDFFSCRVLQELSGTTTDCPATGVPTCYAAYDIELTVTFDDPAIDCPEALSNDAGWDGPPWLAIGALPAELASDSPHEDYVLGWYIGYEDGTRLPHGYAYAETLDEGGEPAGIGWLEDVPYILWPGYVWEL